MSLIVSIDRTSLTLAPLVLSGTTDSNPWGVAAFQEPGLVWRVTYMPDNPDVDGSEAIGWSRQQGLLSWEAFPTAASEAALDAMVDELEAAVSQAPPFTITRDIDGSQRIWTADAPGAVTPLEGRSFVDLRNHDPILVVTIPVYPVAS